MARLRSFVILNTSLVTLTITFYACFKLNGLPDYIAAPWSITMSMFIMLSAAIVIAFYKVMEKRMEVIEK